MKSFWDLIPASAWPVQPFTWPLDPMQLSGRPQQTAARGDASTPTAPAFGWAPAQAAAASAPAFGWAPASAAAPGSPTDPGGNDRSTILGASPDADIPDPADTARLAEDGRRAYELVMWAFGPPSRRPAQRTRELAANPGPSTNAPAIPIAATAAAPPQRTDTQAPPPSAADIRAQMDAARNAYWGGVVPKPGQTLPPPSDIERQMDAARKAILWGMVPESWKPVSDETWADYNRKMAWYMQHPEYVGKMNLPDVGQDPVTNITRAVLDGVMLGLPAEGAGAKVAAGLLPMAKAALRGLVDNAERSAVRGALRAGTEPLSPGLLAQATRLTHPGAGGFTNMADAPTLRGPIDQAVAGARGEPHTAYATYEVLPGDATGHRPGLQAASQAEKDAYSLDPRASWALAPGNRDAIYSTFPSRQVQPTLPTQGVWVNDAGNLELNQGFAARPVVSLENAPGGGRQIAAQDRGALRLAETTRGTIDGQEAGGAHAVITTGNKASEMGSLAVPHEGPLTREEATQLREVGRRYGLPDVVDRGDGVTLTNFMSAPDGRVTGSLLARNDLPRDIAGVLPGPMPARARIDSVYVPLGQYWKQGEGSGAVTRNLLAELEKEPMLARHLDASETIPQVARNKHALDAERAGSDTLRQDLQNLREIVGQGPGWQQRLRDALASLPSLVLPGIAIPYLASRDDGR
jgi:hypothetical protein